jgi:hypothetical protein
MFPVAMVEPTRSKGDLERKQKFEVEVSTRSRSCVLGSSVMRKKDFGSDDDQSDEIAGPGCRGWLA